MSAALYCDVMLQWDAQVPGVPMDHVGAAICGSHERGMNRRQNALERLFFHLGLKAEFCAFQAISPGKCSSRQSGAL